MKLPFKFKALAAYFNAYFPNIEILGGRGGRLDREKKHKKRCFQLANE